MFKTLVAGVTAASLMFTTAVPAQANGFSEQDFNNFILGLMAVAGIAAVIDHSQSNAGTNTQGNGGNVAPKPRTPRHPTGPRNGGYGNNPQSNGHGQTIRVPRRCVEKVSTRYGDQRLVDRRCIRRTTNLLNIMPGQCRVRIPTNAGIRGGWDPLCLRDHGIRISRRN